MDILVFSYESRARTASIAGIAGIAPDFSTQRLATALPKRAYSQALSSVSASGFRPSRVMQVSTPAQKESPAPVASTAFAAKPGTYRPPSRVHT